MGGPSGAEADAGPGPGSGAPQSLSQHSAPGPGPRPPAGGPAAPAGRRVTSVGSGGGLAPLRSSSLGGGAAGAEGAAQVKALKEAEGEGGRASGVGARAGGPSGSGPAASAAAANPADNPRVKLRQLASTYSQIPSILRKRKAMDNVSKENVGDEVVDWNSLRSISERRARAAETRSLSSRDMVARKYLNKVGRKSPVVKLKGQSGNKMYTSKYRGVHQTLPTRRWEAQFRKNGKPTSLGCFNTEDEAARAYDTMMMWIMIHSTDPKAAEKTITNFPLSEYEHKLKDLQTMQQEELLLGLRRCGRKQAAGIKASDQNSHPILNYLENDSSDEGRIREDIGLGDKDPTCKQMYDRLSEVAPEFLPQKARGGSYLLGTLKMQRPTLVKAYIRWLDSNGGKDGKKAAEPKRADKK